MCGGRFMVFCLISSHKTSSLSKGYIEYDIGKELQLPCPNNGACTSRKSSKTNLVKVEFVAIFFENRINVCMAGMRMVLTRYTFFVSSIDW